MCKTILLIAVFGLQQLIEASVLKNFGDTHNELPHAYEKSKDELIRNKLNLRSFKNTPFLYFNVRTEDEQSRTRCQERSPNDNACTEFELTSVNCSNLNYRKNPRPKWRCEYRFYQRGPRSLIISDFKIKCADPSGLGSRSYYYEKDSCDYEFRLKLDEDSLRDNNKEDDHLADPENKTLLITATALAGSSFFVLFLVIVCACVHAARESRGDNTIDDLDYCPDCSAFCADCTCDHQCMNCLDACATGCCHGLASSFFDACFSAGCEACCEAGCDVCCKCTGEVAVGIASSSFR